MNKSVLKFGLMSVLFLMTVSVAFAQKTFNLQDNPELVVSGTSTLHDWDMPSNKATGKMVAAEEGGKLTQINSLEVVMPAESIKSGKKAMDKKAYTAMKTDQHKNVVFKLTKAVKSGDQWTIDGTFNIAGVSKNVSLKVSETHQGGAYQLKGEYSFKLTDYKIDPPTAVMGTIKTGDEVKITFDVNFK